MDDGIFLHIQSEKHIHAAFKEFPDDTDGHGEAECHQSEEKGGQLHRHPFVIVQQHDHGKADSRGKESVQSMQDGIPEGDKNVKFIDLTQDFRAKDKEQHDNLQGSRQLNLEIDLDKAGNEEQKQSQDTEKHILIILIHDLSDHHKNDQRTEHNVYGKRAFMLTKLHFYSLPHILSPGRFFVPFVFSFFQWNLPPVSLCRVIFAYGYHYNT